MLDRVVSVGTYISHLSYLKEQPRQKGLQNEEITARVTKLLAEAENQRA